MQPMLVGPLRQALAEADIISADDNSGAIKGVVDGFDTLKTEPKLDAAGKRLLFECCVVLVNHGFWGKRGEAQTVLLGLTQANPKFKFRTDAANE